MQNLLRNPPSYAMQALASITFTKKLLMAILYKCFNSNKQIWEQAWGQILEYLYFVVFKYLFLVFVFVFLFCGHSSICICS